MDSSLSGPSRKAVGRHRAPSPVLAPGSALGSRPRVARSSTQVRSVYPGALRPCKCLLLGPGPPLGVGRLQFLRSFGPDCLGPTGQRDTGDRAVQAHRVVVVLDELGDQPPSVLTSSTAS